jgi:hypothetical protein
MNSHNKGLPKNKFTPEEDIYLKEVIEHCGCKDWTEVAAYFPGRNPRQCRERWNNYVKPTIMKLPWSPFEDRLLEQKYADLGPKWHLIAKFFPNRSRNYVKNRWLTKQRHLHKHNQIHETISEPTVAPLAVPPPPMTLEASTDDHPAADPPSFVDDPFFFGQHDDDGLWNTFDWNFF